MFFASKLKAKAETIPLQVWNLAHQPTATALVMPCANPAPKVHLASKWHVSSNWSKLQLKTPHRCWMFLISQEQFTMNKAMPQPVDSGINVTGVVGALGATSLPSIGHDTRCADLHVGRSFGHLGPTFTFRKGKEGNAQQWTLSTRPSRLQRPEVHLSYRHKNKQNPLSPRCDWCGCSTKCLGWPQRCWQRFTTSPFGWVGWSSGNANAQSLGFPAANVMPNRFAVPSLASRIDP